MNQVTVREILQILQEYGVTLLAGASGLNNEVSSISVLEISNPSNSWIVGGELILSTLQVFRSASEVSDVISELHARHAAALGAHQGVGESTFDPLLLEKADRLGFPIFLIPCHVPYSVIFSSVYERVFNRQAEHLLKSAEINSALTQTLLTQDNIESIASTLSSILKKPIIILDERFCVLAFSLLTTLGEDLLNQITTGELNSFFSQVGGQGNADGYGNPHRVPLSLPSGDFIVILYCAFYGGECVGSIMTLGRKNHDDYEAQIDLMGLAHSATTLAILQMKKRAVHDAEQRMRGNLYNDLLSGHIQSEELLSVQSVKLDIPLCGGHRVLAIQIVDWKTSHREDDPLYEQWEYLGRTARHCCDCITQKSSVIPKGDGYLVVLHFSEHLSDRAKSLHLTEFLDMIEKQTSARLPDLQLVIGISNLQDSLLQLPTSYQQASASIALGRKISGEENIFYYGQMGVYSLLDVDSMAELHSTCAAELKTLAAQCGKNAAGLFDTLEAYFDAGESIINTAKVLDVHVNTVKYRIDKAKDFLGSHLLQNGKEKLRLYLLLKIRKLL